MNIEVFTDYDIDVKYSVIFNPFSHYWHVVANFDGDHHMYIFPTPISTYQEALKVAKEKCDG